MSDRLNSAKVTKDLKEIKTMLVELTEFAHRVLARTEDIMAERTTDTQEGETDG